MNTSYELVLNENKLMALHYRNDPIEFTPFGKDCFISPTAYMGKLEFIRNEKNNVIGFFVSGQKSRKIEFVKIADE